MQATLKKVNLIRLICSLMLTATPIAQADFIRGDIDGDGNVSLSDLILLQEIVGETVIGYAPPVYSIFNPPPAPIDYGCPDKADINDDGMVDSHDAIRLSQYLYGAGVPPEHPFPNAGEDLQADGYACGNPIFAGNDASGNGWIKIMHRKFNAPTEYKLVSVVDAVGGLKDIQSISFAGDYTTLAVLSKNSAGFARISYVSTLALNQITHIHDGLLDGPPAALNKYSQEIVVEDSGNFVLVEQDEPTPSETPVVHQVSIVNPASNIPLAAHPVTVIPWAIRMEDADNAIIVRSSSRHSKINISRTHLQSGSVSTICSAAGGIGEMVDLVIDRRANGGDFITYSDNVFSGEEDALFVCPKNGGNFGRMIDVNEFPGLTFDDELLAIEQWPTFNPADSANPLLQDQPILVVGRPLGSNSIRVFVLDNDLPYDTAVEVFRSSDLNGVTDVVSLPAD